MDTLPLFKRDVLVSIRPEYISKILNGEKTIELRRKFPAVTAIGALALLYSTSPVQAVVAYARIKDVRKLSVSDIWKNHGAAACVSKKEFYSYFAGLEYGFAIFLDQVRPLKRQINARDLQIEFGIVPPQSYRYVQGECTSLLSDGQVQPSHRHKRRHRA